MSGEKPKPGPVDLAEVADALRDPASLTAIPVAGV